MGSIKRHLGVKIFLGLAGCSLLVSVIIFFVLQFAMPQMFRTDLSDSFYQGLDTLITELEQTPAEDAWPLLMAFSVRYSADLSLLEEDGTELMSVRGASNFGASEQSAYHLFSGAIGISNEYESGATAYVLVATLSMQEVAVLGDIFIRIMPYILLLALGLSALIAYVYSRRITRPIVALSNTAEHLAGLDLSWRSPIKREDEIGVLSDHLNAMAEHLDRALTQLQESNRRLQDDMERERALERQRADFFAAVSHELKTPITVAKYDLEGMIHGIGRYKDRDTYLAHAYQVVGKIEALVQEIMEVTRLSSNQIPLHREGVDFSALVLACCKGYQALAAHRDIALEYEIPPGVTAEMDRRHMERAVSNLLANAVSHSPAGSRVTVTLTETSLEVTNTGVTIPAEDLEQIFLPFYRVDASRSRHTGGSGLGLYLVKMILDLHGYGIEIKNEGLGVSTTVTFCR